MKNLPGGIYTLYYSKKESNANIMWIMTIITHESNRKEMVFFLTTLEYKRLDCLILSRTYDVYHANNSSIRPMFYLNLSHLLHTWYN